jgi:hypothetical protein
VEAAATDARLAKQQEVVDAALAKLDDCTRKLAKGGNLTVSWIPGENGGTNEVYVTQSTVRDCQAVACVKKHLRSAGLGEGPEFPANVDVALVPHERPYEVSDVKWPDGAESQYCADRQEDLDKICGRLPPEQIQSIIRGRYPAIRECYDVGLAFNPRLKGRVATRFVIGRDGHVSSSYVAENEVRDCRVAECVRKEITKCVFPKPKCGVVTVVYPLMFEPG